MKGLVAITGASAGIGAATAKLFHQQGYALLLIGRRADRLQDLCNELQNDVKIAVVDVNDRKAVLEALQNQPIDVLVNNAGIALGLESFETYDVDDFNQMIQTNIQGLLHCTHAVLPNMIERNKGHIINMGSIAGEVAYAGGNVYGATKAFVKQFSRNLRIDLLGKKIRVTNIAPGAVETEFSLVRFKGDVERANGVYAGTKALRAEDIANAILYCVGSPWHVNVDYMEIMPTYQACNGFKTYRE